MDYWKYFAMVLLVPSVKADNCACSYAELLAVHAHPTSSSNSIGYLTTGECLHVVTPPTYLDPQQWTAVIVHKNFLLHEIDMTGYLKVGPNVRIQSCQNSMSVCNPSHCVHGFCTKSGCECDNGFSGPNCDQCGSNICVHGICINHLDPPICYCNEGKTGTTCETEHSCESGSYSVGGTCNANGTRDCPVNICKPGHHCYDALNTTFCLVNTTVDIDKVSVADGCPHGKIKDIRGICREAPGCFPGDGEVLMADFTTKQMSDISVGDTVMTVDSEGHLTPTSVILLLYKIADIDKNFIVLENQEGRELRLTEHHLVYTTQNPGGDIHVKYAINVRKGEYLQFVHDNLTTTSWSKVVKVHSRDYRGMYAPLTDAGSLIVDQHLVSAYGEYEDHDLIHLMMAPWRTMSYLSRMFWDSPPFSPQQRGFHWTVELLPKLMCSVYETEHCKYFYTERYTAL